MPSGDKTTAAALLDIGRTAAYELSPKGAMAEPGSASWQFVRIPTGPLLELLQLRRNRQIAPPGRPDVRLPAPVGLRTSHVTHIAHCDARVPGTASQPDIRTLAGRVWPQGLRG
jgi:hypothetical protein